MEGRATSGVRGDQGTARQPRGPNARPEEWLLTWNLAPLGRRGLWYFQNV